MSLVTLKDIMIPARAGGYAVAAFEVWDMASVQAVCGAAEQLKQPVILQLGPKEIDYAGLDDVSRIALDYAHRASIPVAVHLDHGDSFERVMQCIHCGFSSVMLDMSHLPFDENVSATRRVSEVAHACGISVEGELGRIGGGETGVEVEASEAFLTDPDEAVEFVRLTGVDVLAVAIGTKHGFYKEDPVLRFDLLKAIADKVSIPLVLHGGSGIPEEGVRKCISLGMAKLNICTEFVDAFSKSFVEQRSRANFQCDVPNVFSGPREAAKQKVMEKIRLAAGLDTVCR